MTRMIGNATRAAGLVAAVLASCACAPSPGQAVAQRIRESNSPAIATVVFRPENMLDPEEVDVWLAPGVSGAVADRLWCDVIAPAGGSQELVVVRNATGTSMMATDPPCQPGTNEAIPAATTR